MMSDKEQKEYNATYEVMASLERFTLKERIDFLMGLLENARKGMDEDQRMRHARIGGRQCPICGGFRCMYRDSELPEGGTWWKCYQTGEG